MNIFDFGTASHVLMKQKGNGGGSGKNKKQELNRFGLKPVTGFRIGGR